ncbi:MAG: protoporphyrinogen oxidase HemJ [Pseudomonadales bacterium]
MDFGSLYPWLKSLHIIAVIYWMAGMFMLPRYFAYHAECAQGSEEDALWQSRERKLIRIIINPAMMVVWVVGIWLAIGLDVLTSGWMLMKLALVIGLSALHGMLSRWRRDFANGSNKRSSKFFRMVNEIPTLTVILIVLLVVVKPFS